MTDAHGLPVLPEQVGTGLRRLAHDHPPALHYSCVPVFVNAPLRPIEPTLNGHFFPPAFVSQPLLRQAQDRLTPPYQGDGRAPLSSPPDKGGQGGSPASGSD